MTLWQILYCEEFQFWDDNSSKLRSSPLRYGVDLIYVLSPLNSLFYLFNFRGVGRRTCCKYGQYLRKCNYCFKVISKQSNYLPVATSVIHSIVRSKPLKCNFLRIFGRHVTGLCVEQLTESFFLGIGWTIYVYIIYLFHIIILFLFY